MNVEIENVKKLLAATRSISIHQEEIKRLRGENFNVFSILGMEKAENKTHSAFIHELLNPKGSHLMGSAFLNLFLQQIEYEEMENFDIDSAFTKVEFHISQRDDEMKTGGRIDIFIRDKNNRTISIENKIDAGDQDYQIERYANFNKDKNTVFYLTKFGEPPSDISKGKKEEKRDYFCISYKDTIRGWLEECLKEATQQPILRESISQYIILIRKLTNTMDNSQEKQLKKLMISNYSEAEYIASNFEALKSEIRDSIRKATIKLLKAKIEELDLGLKVENGSKITGTYAQIWINKEHTKFRYGIESFSGRGNFGGDLYVGVLVSDAEGLPASIGNSTGWKIPTFIRNNDGSEINFSNSELIAKLYNDKDYHENLAFNISDQVMDFIVKNPIF